MEAPVPPTQPDQSKADRRAGILAWLAALALFVLGLTLLPGLGIGWDDRVHATYGEMVLKFFQSGGADQRHAGYLDLMLYGPWVDMLAAVLYGGEGQRDYAVRHGVAMFFAALTLPAAYYLGRAGAGWRGGLAALVALALMPRFMGHGMFNTKDIPFACFFAWSFAWVWGLRGTSWRLDWRGALGLGVFAGLAMGIRVGGLLVFVILGVAAGIAWLHELAMDRWKPSPARLRETGVALGWWVVAFVIAYGMMIAVWPWTWDAPLERPLQALRDFSSFHHRVWIFYEGKVIDSTRVPLSYLPGHLILGTPEVTLLFIGLGLGALLAGIRRAFTLSTPLSPVALGTLTWLFFPLLYVMFTGPTLYGSARQFLFIIPSLAVLAGIGMAHLWSWTRTGRPVVICLVLIGIGSTLAAIFSLHPYQYTYYNAWAGPRETLHERYELEDWAFSFREAAEWLNQRQVERPERPLRVLAKMSEYSLPCLISYLDPLVQARPYLFPSFDRTDMAAQNPYLPEGVDYYVTVTGPEGNRMFPGSPVVHRIKAGGATICIIRGQEDPPAVIEVGAPAQ